MNRQQRASKKLSSSQGKQYNQNITVNGEPLQAAVDRYVPTFDGVAVEVIEVEIHRSLAPFGLRNGHTVDIGDKPRLIRSMGGDEDYLLLILEI